MWAVVHMGTRQIIALFQYHHDAVQWHMEMPKAEYHATERVPDLTANPDVRVGKDKIYLEQR